MHGSLPACTSVPALIHLKFTMLSSCYSLRPFHSIKERHHKDNIYIPPPLPPHPHITLSWATPVV